MSAVIVSISVLVIVLAVMSVGFVVMFVVMTESVVSLAVMSVWGIRLFVVSAGAVMSVRGVGVFVVIVAEVLSVGVVRWVVVSFSVVVGVAVSVSVSSKMTEILWRLPQISHALHTNRVCCRVPWGLSPAKLYFFHDLTFCVGQTQFPSKLLSPLCSLTINDLFTISITQYNIQVC